ncbi:MAG TPA: hypothetical protein VGO50_02980 [Pyrinomonadaceae bacterium]|jgi:hypothetical protein|nr:hypothetical protein [Pyrinomonadaceae bacterium]
MALTRRKFTQVAGAAMVGIGFAGAASRTFSQSSRPGGLFPVTGEAASDMLMSFNSETFAPYVGTIFRSGQSGYSFRLAEVVDHGRSKEKRFGMAGESFSLFFRSVGRKNVPQDIHTFEHPSLGTFSLFIAPVERGGKTYEAVINHSSLL